MSDSVAFGTPVAAAGVDGIPELLGLDCGGIATPLGDAALFADAICRLLGDAEHRRLLCRQAAENAHRRFDCRRVFGLVP